MRLITRSDFDGLACGLLLSSAGLIDSWKFTEPDEIRDGTTLITENDILANMPFTEGCGLWFDNRSSEQERQQYKGRYKGESSIMPSTARIIYEYYGGKERFPEYDELMEAVDNEVSGNLTRDEILNPKGWIMIGFLIDPVIGAERFRNFTISNSQLMDKLMNECSNKSAEEILDMDDVKERMDSYNEQTDLFKDMIHKYTKVKKDAIITDLRGVNPVYAGNRYIIYSLYPEQNISCLITDCKGGTGCSCSVGYSILNRTSNVNIGNIMIKYGGEGYKSAGICRFGDDEAAEKVPKLLKDLIDYGEI